MAYVQVPAPAPGTQFGRLTVVREVALIINGQKIRGLEVACNCGAVFQTRLLYVTGGRTRSCGCLNKDRVTERNKTPEARERTRQLNKPQVPAPQPGTKFGRGVVQREVRQSSGGKEIRALELTCDCGNVYTALLHNVLQGRSQSCGCLRRDLVVTGNQTLEARSRTRLGTPTHGLRSHPLYRTWSNMKERCENPANKGYFWYGQRGIAICERWHDVRLFIGDIEREIGPRPPGLTLDRRNNNGNYEPGNVRWATRSQQVRNSRKCLP